MYACTCTDMYPSNSGDERRFSSQVELAYIAAPAEILTSDAAYCSYHITTYMYDKMRKYRALMYSTYVSAFSKEEANKYCTILYKYMYHTYMHTYITFLRIGTSDHSRKLSNTAD